MTLPRFAAVCLALAVLTFAPAARADGLADSQPSYTRMAGQCGESADRPSFSAAEYVGALKDAAAALKSAKKEGNRSRQDAIKQSVERLKECQKEEERKIPIPPIRNCTEFINAYKVFAARAATLIAAAKITTTDRDRLRETFRPPAVSCVREMMSHCIDPNKTSDIDHVIEAMNAASVLGVAFSYHNESGIDRILTTTSPAYLRMTFCTDTDFKCKGDVAACTKRTVAIKAIMETYINKW